MLKTADMMPFPRERTDPAPDPPIGEWRPQFTSRQNPVHILGESSVYTAAISKETTKMLITLMPPPGILPGGCDTRVPASQTPEVRAARQRFGEALLSLPGVTGIGGSNALVVSTVTVDEAERLSAILRDTLEGAPVKFEALGRGVPPHRPEVVAAREVDRRYHDPLSHLPNVVDVGVRQRSCGPLLPAFEERLVVYVDRPSALKYRQMLRDSIDGVRVNVETRCW
jgi:hypothetical protein